MGGSFNEWVFIHSFICGVGQVPGSNVSTQVTMVPFRASLASPEFFISQAMSRLVINGRHSLCFPLIVFPICSGLDAESF